MKPTASRRQFDCIELNRRSDGAVCIGRLLPSSITWNSKPLAAAGPHGPALPQAEGISLHARQQTLPRVMIRQMGRQELAFGNAEQGDHNTGVLVILGTRGLALEEELQIGGKMRNTTG